MSYGKKSIDIVRERIKERIEEGAKTPEEKRLLDAAYAHNVNLVLDLKILAHTALVVLLKKDIYTN